MRKMVKRLAARLMPEATGKATRIEGRCYSGCGYYGVWIASPGKAPAGKVPCC